MEYIKRNKSIITGKENLEHLYTFKDFPVFMGCTEEPIKDDLKADMSFSICKDSGIIQLDNLLPLDTVYQEQHNDGIGKMWQDHYVAFSNFLSEFGAKDILEIGGANDFIARDFTNKNPSSRWIVVEPHPLFNESEKIKIIKGWFDEKFSFKDDVDTVVHSHVLEHTYNPESFISHISSFLSIGERHVFTIPNMEKQLQNKFTNCLNFEHTAFLAEPYVDYLLQKNGFTIVKKYYYEDHSIFYSTIKSNDNKQIIATPNLYKKYKEMFMDYINYHIGLVNKINVFWEDYKGTSYIFGAHIFTQYLIVFGIRENMLSAVLDNSDLKNGKRLYGTNLKVQKPDVIKNISDCAVILKVGSYRDEIINQLKEINPDVLIIE